MVNYYTISYKLKEHDLSGAAHDFSKTVTSYIAHEIAESEQEAVDKLKADFSMLDIEVISVSGRKTVPDEDFAAGKLT